MAAIRPATIPISATKRPLRNPSTTVPPLMIVSNRAMRLSPFLCPYNGQINHFLRHYDRTIDSAQGPATMMRRRVETAVHDEQGAADSVEGRECAGRGRCSRPNGHRGAERVAS